MMNNLSRINYPTLLSCVIVLGTSHLCFTIFLATLIKCSHSVLTQNYYCLLVLLFETFHKILSSCNHKVSLFSTEHYIRLSLLLHALFLEVEISTVVEYNGYQILSFIIFLMYFHKDWVFCL